MSSKIITLTIALVLFTLTSSQCPVFPTFNITTSRLLGTWYQIAATPWARRTFERNCVCSVAYYKPGDGKINLDQSCRGSKPDGTLYRYYGTARVMNVTDPGKLEVEFQGQPGKAVLWVVDTDYQEYYVSWSCSVVLGVKIDNMWLASRKPTMSIETFRVIAEKMKKITGFDTRQFILTNHTGCTYPN